MSDSQVRLPHGTPRCDSYVHTDGRTNEEVGDLNNSLALRNAQEQNADSASEFKTAADQLASIAQQLATASERLPIVRQAEHRELDPDVRKMVLLRDRYTCQWCRRHVRDGLPLEVDHIVPWSAGGSNATDNLRTLCEDCNQSRSNRRTDAYTATALLIVGNCPWCQGRHLIETWDDGAMHRTYVYDEDAPQITAADREVPVWCITCRTHSTTSRNHADRVRAKQAHRVAPPREDT